jgi:hypothetical protein
MGFKLDDAIRGKWKFSKIGSPEKKVVVELGFLPSKRLDNDEVLGIYIWGVKLEKKNNTLYINSRYCDNDMISKALVAFDKHN